MFQAINELPKEMIKSAIAESQKSQKIWDILFGIGTIALVVTAVVYWIWQLATLDPLVTKSFIHIGGFKP